MPETKKQFAIFNVPINPNADVPPVDSWLYEFPVHTFDLDTPEQRVFKTYETARSAGVRRIGQSQLEARLILKVRHVHFTNWTKVLGADAVKERDFA